MDPSVDTAPIAPALAAFFDNVLDQSISQLNFKVTPCLSMVKFLCCRNASYLPASLSHAQQTFRGHQGYENWQDLHTLALGVRGYIGTPQIVPKALL